MSVAGAEAGLVTGATGFIGQHLCRKLVELGVTTYGLSRSATEATVPSGVIPIAADVTQRATVVEALEQVRPSHVVHLAAAGVTEPFLPIEQASGRQRLRHRTRVGS